MIHSSAKVLSISNNHFVHRHDKNFGIKFNLSSPKIWSSLIKYSGDLKADPSKTGNIPKPDFLKISFQMVSTKMIFLRYLWCSFWQPYCIYHWKFGLKSLDFKWLMQNGCQKVQISNCQSKMAAKNTILANYVWYSNVICKPTFFPPFEIRSCPDFRSPLYFSWRRVPFKKAWPLLHKNFFHIAVFCRHQNANQNKKLNAK